MKINLLFISLFILSLLALNSCGKAGNGIELSGNYKITSVKAVNCEYPEENLDLEFDESGCAVEQGFEICVAGPLSFNSGNYTLSLDVTFGDNSFGDNSFGDTETDNGTYTIDGSNFTLCSNGTDCEEGMITINGDVITISGFTDEDGCEQTIVAKKS